jgi:hypothetical protein
MRRLRKVHAGRERIISEESWVSSRPFLGVHIRVHAPLIDQCSALTKLTTNVSLSRKQY